MHVLLVHASVTMMVERAQRPQAKRSHEAAGRNIQVVIVQSKIDHPAEDVVRHPLQRRRAVVTRQTLIERV
ncbi:MAG: hypothetical protein JOZ28_02645 [Candidatus Eremiobacteraeota bacterium]|nr:hypothetical protein [Candidatus Eremiobacteraeota bacterium]